MKRSILALLAVIICHVSGRAETPYEVAERFFKQEGSTNRAKQQTPRLKKVSADMGEVEVYNRQGGGFIVLAEKAGQWNVIGYSEEGSFAVNEGKERVIRTLFNPDSIPEHVCNVAEPGTPVKGPYLTTQWNQGEPYNGLCPYDTVAQRRMWAGCTTVAMAQLLNYYRSPSRSTYHRFDWDNMLDKYEDGNYTEQEANAVATLFADLAQEALHINFSAEDGSSGVFPMFYEGFSQIYIKSDDWLDFLNQTDKPQILSIRNIDNSATLSHAVIMDGIDSNGFWHINWGWGGHCDGWFQPNYFEIMHNGEERILSLAGKAAESQRFLNPDSNYHLPGMKLDGGVKIQPQFPKAGDMVTVTLCNIQYTNTNYCNFSFKKSYGSAFCLSLYYPFPWRTTGTVNGIGIGGYYYQWKYNPAYVGKQFVIPGSNSRSLANTDMKYNTNFTGTDITLTFTMPDLPDGQDMILRPEYYLYWNDTSYQRRIWPGDETSVIALGSNWWAFPSLDNISNCFVLHKNPDGTYTATATSLGDLTYSYGLSAGIEDIMTDRCPTEKKIVGYYNLAGIYSSTAHKGFNIIRYSDGTTDKVIRK